MKYKLKDSTDLGIDWADVGPWRSYEVSNAEGSNLEEMLASAQISEIDQDGGDLNNYGIEKAGREVANSVEELCREEIRLTDLAYQSGLRVIKKEEEE